METAVENSYMYSSALIAEIEQEAQSLRKSLERVPAEKFDWKPHEKSMSFAQLASHVAELISWTVPTLTAPELDFATMDYKPFVPQTTQDLVDFFERNLSEAIETLNNTPDALYGEMWTLRQGEQIFFTMPKAAVMRGFVLSHLYHHRGQLSVYLRLNDIPVPSLYGPSADESI